MAEYDWPLMLQVKLLDATGESNKFVTGVENKAQNLMAALHTGSSVRTC